MKAEFEAAGQKVEVDFTDMEKRLDDKTKALFEQFRKELREAPPDNDKDGKGVIEPFDPTAKAKLIEEFQKGERCDPAKIKEQWTIAVPKFARYELAAHLRDFVWVTDVVKGKPGETVNIPYVNDVDFTHEATPHTGGSLTGVTGLINVLTTTLHESGVYYDAYYGDIEKIDANMLDELNRVFAHAAVRAEDLDLVALVNTATSGQFVSEGGGTDVTPPIWVGTNASYMNPRLVIDALAALMRRGKEIHPGECVLVMRPQHWSYLMKDLLSTTSTSSVKPSMETRGLVEDFLGVKILITHYPTYWHSEQDNVISSYQMAYLMRPKRALALAPKRDILIETDKLIKERQLRIAASHTYGVRAIDLTEVVPILSGSCKGAGGG